VVVPTKVDVSDAGSHGSMNRCKGARELGYAFDPLIPAAPHFRLSVIPT
jgi:hypothetical protein